MQLSCNKNRNFPSYIYIGKEEIKRYSMKTFIKRVAFTLSLLLILSCYAYAQTTWASVGAGSSKNSFISVTKVVFNPDCTEVTMHLDFVPGRTVGFSSRMYLDDGNKHYPVKASTVVTLDQPYTLPESGIVDFTLTFDALPQGIKHFDLVEPGGYTIPNIHSTEELPTGMENTYWRNDATGDWLIGFTENGVIYDCKVWDIKQQERKKDKYRYTIYDATSATELEIEVGKLKKGQRSIAIEGMRTAKCSPITTPTLPYYPEKDTISTIRNNGYRMCDSVTIAGWLKDMPQWAWQRGAELEIFFENILTGDQETVFAKMDSLGRFTLKIPLLNSLEAIIYVNKSICTCLEPGEIYYLLYDFTTGQKLFMGKNCRLQNELLSHTYQWSNDKALKTQAPDPMTYLALTDSVRKVHINKLNDEIAQHPTLSVRYEKYLTGCYFGRQAFDVMQARFHYMRLGYDKMPDAYMEYAANELWPQFTAPHTLLSDFHTFYVDYIDEKSKDFTFDLSLYDMHKDGYITLSDEEIECVKAYEEEIERTKEEIAQKSDDAERNAIVEKLNNSAISKNFVKIAEKYLPQVTIIAEKRLLDRLNDVLDSVSCDEQLRDIIQAYSIGQELEASREPLDTFYLDFVEREIELPAVKQFIMERHNKYLALQQGDIANAASLRPSSDVADMTDGEKILRKLLEPYNGRVVLLDIWGSWCGPCRENLANMHVVKEALKDFDIVYLYLANRTDEQSWKSIIKEYNLTGENSIHYNLPQGQQKAVENYLNVNSFPTYKLIDKQGNIHELNWLYIRQPDELKKIIEQIAR